MRLTGRPLASGAVEHGGRRTELFAALEDPQRLAAALPHVSDLELCTNGGFSVNLRPALALGEVPIETRWLLRDRQPHAHLLWEVQGRSSESRLDMRCSVVLDDSMAHWSVEIFASGPLRAMSQRTLAAIVRHQADLVLRTALV